MFCVDNLSKNVKTRAIRPRFVVFCYQLFFRVHYKRCDKPRATMFLAYARRTCSANCKLRLETDLINA